METQDKTNEYTRPAERTSPSLGENAQDITNRKIPLFIEWAEGDVYTRVEENEEKSITVFLGGDKCGDGPDAAFSGGVGSAEDIGLIENGDAFFIVANDEENSEKDVTDTDFVGENDNSDLHIPADDSDLQVDIDADEREFVFLGGDTLTLDGERRDSFLLVTMPESPAADAGRACSRRDDFSEDNSFFSRSRDYSEFAPTDTDLDHSEFAPSDTDEVFNKNAARARARAQKRRDMEFIIARDAFERRKMKSEYQRVAMRFGQLTSSEERELRILRRSLRRAPSRLRHGKAAERFDNDRYYHLLTVDPLTARIAPEGNRDRLIALCREAESLLAERDDCNRELTALYRGRSGWWGIPVSERAAEAEYRASLREYKRLLPLAGEISKKGTTRSRREQAYILMDERVALVGKLAAIDYRLGHERMSWLTRRGMRRSRRIMRRDLKDNAILLNRHTEMALIDIKRYFAVNFSVAMGILGLATLVAAGILIWYFREPIWELIKSLYYKIVGAIPPPKFKINWDAIGLMREEWLL